MKSTELRIGNLVTQNIAKKEFRVVGLNNKGAFISVEKDLDCIGINARNGLPCLYCYIDPIPLTEEWFLKLGFRKEVYSDFDEEIDEEYEEIEFFIKTESGIEISSDDKGVKVYTDNCDGEVIPLTHIKHVHQLQNLFHALTGEELIMKP